MVQALARAGCAVTFVLKAPIRTGRLVDPLRDLPGVTVHSPHATGRIAAQVPLPPRWAATVLSELDEAEPFDLVVVRGRRLAAKLAAGRLAGRLWTYLTDIPQAAGDMTHRDAAELGRVADASRLLLCQTEELRGFLEAAVPAASGKAVLFPPVVAVPDGIEPAPRDGGPLRLVYTGKFAPRWNTLEMTRLPARLAARGVDAELHMVGDKIHDDPDDASYAGRMGAALSASGVVAHGGRSRAEAMAITAGCDVGVSWRHPSLDASLELSTKLLECGLLGVPVVLNRTPMHERLFGADYPLFAATEDDVVDVLAALDPPRLARAAERCRAAAEGYTLDAAAGRLRRYLAQVFPAPSLGRKIRVGVAGHDLKFFTRLLDYLKSHPDVEVRVDHWSALKAHDPAKGEALLDWADVIICEWCGPNALWYAERKRPGQRLVVRLHRFELYADWPKRLDIDAVDQVVCVSPHYRDLTLERTGWPAEKVTVIPNWVDDDQLDRPKLAGAEHHLGMIGIAPSRKRLDLALDVVAELRRDDPRFTLFVKSKLPWDYWWIWQKADERAHYEKAFRRIRRDPLLSGGVVFDPYGRDVAAWLRRIGWVLSTSDDESFHLAPAEGMASGAVPALLDWPGADTIYDRRWIHAGPKAMAAEIAASVSTGRWEHDRLDARDQVRGAYGLDEVCHRYLDLVAGARTVVAPGIG
nr:glycosyltransferase [Actinomadura flavalba]